MELVFIVIVALVLLVIAGYGAGIYNGLIVVSQNIAKAWANIDVLLKQRHDELPKLMDVCKGYMTHEKGMIDKVLQARATVMGAHGPAQVGKADGELSGALKQLFALAENYPDLKAQTSFQQLQARVSSLESEIADRREFYNDSVNSYNIRIQTLPDVFIARFLGMATKEMFQVAATDREDVKIAFS